MIAKRINKKKSESRIADFAAEMFHCVEKCVSLQHKTNSNLSLFYYLFALSSKMKVKECVKIDYKPLKTFQVWKLLKSRNSQPARRSRCSTTSVSSGNQPAHSARRGEDTRPSAYLSFRCVVFNIFFAGFCQSSLLFVLFLRYCRSLG